MNLLQQMHPYHLYEMSSYFGMSSYSWDEFLIQNFKNISFLTEIQSHVLVVTKISLCEDHSEVTYNPKDSCKKFSILGGVLKKRMDTNFLARKSLQDVKYFDYIVIFLMPQP